MQSVRAQGDQTIYQYNALGERVRKSNNQEQTDYLYGEDGKLLGEYRREGMPKVEYLWLGDIPVGAVKFDDTGRGSLYYVESDQLNTPRIITASNKKVMWQWQSEPFGSTAVVNNPFGQGAFTYNLRFAGQYYDRESGLHYNYFRDYDPQTGRYVQSDPVGLEAGVNTYVYVGGNPVSNQDQFGLWSITAGGYAGAGGQVSFGSDHGNGFFTGRVGFGLGGGIAFNPKGGMPGEAPDDRDKGGVVLSCSGEASLSFFPLVAGVEGGVARNYNNARSVFYGSPPSISVREGYIGIHLGGSFGAQVTGYSGRR